MEHLLQPFRDLAHFAAVFLASRRDILIAVERHQVERVNKILAPDAEETWRELHPLWHKLPAEPADLREQLAGLLIKMGYRDIENWPAPPLSMDAVASCLEELNPIYRDIEARILASGKASGNLPEADLTEKAKAAIEYIRKNPGAKGDNIAKTISVSPEHFRKHIVKALKSAGLLNKSKRGYYPASL